MFPMTKLLKPECQATLSIALVAIVQLQKPRKKHGKSQPFKPYLQALKTGISAFMIHGVIGVQPSGIRPIPTHHRNDHTFHDQHLKASEYLVRKTQVGIAVALRDQVGGVVGTSNEVTSTVLAYLGFNIQSKLA